MHNARFLEFGEVVQNLPVSDWAEGGVEAVTYSIHRNVLPFLMTFTIDIGIFFALYQYRKYAIFLHALICATCALLTLVTSLQILIPSSFPSEPDARTHAIIGIVITIAIALQIVCGIIAKTLPCLSNHSSSYTIFILNRIHKIVGYLLTILCKVQVFMALDHAEEKSLFWGLLVPDALLCTLFVVRKITMKKMQYLAIPQYEQQEATGIKMIQKLQDLPKSRPPLLGIFANYVYNIQSLTRFHPLGYEIIESIRGREFDRYLYGSLATERLPTVTPNAHSLKSVELLGHPIAKLSIPTVYEGLEEDMREVRLLQMVEISQKGHMYEVRLVNTDGRGFKCNGYSSVYQIGRYFVLNLDNKVSRLYITVSFLAPTNIELLEQLYFRPNNQQIYSPKMNPFNFKISTIESMNTERRLQLIEKVDYLPLFIKKYEGGKLTVPLIQQKFTKLYLSTQRGRGLQLYNLTPGKIVIFIAGTGIIPFGDLIDLLFKAILIQIRPQCRQTIITHNPILGTNSFDGLSFRFYLQQHSYQDIHPLTRAQLLEVAKYPQLLEFHLKCHDKIEDVRVKRSGIRVSTETIEESVKRELSESDDKVAQYWVCCSPIVNEKLMKLFESRRIPQQKFVFL